MAATATTTVTNVTVVTGMKSPSDILLSLSASVLSSQLPLFYVLSPGWNNGTELSTQITELATQLATQVTKQIVNRYPGYSNSTPFCVMCEVPSLTEEQYKDALSKNVRLVELEFPDKKTGYTIMELYPITHVVGYTCDWGNDISHVRKYFVEKSTRKDIKWILINYLKSEINNLQKKFSEIAEHNDLTFSLDKDSDEIYIHNICIEAACKECGESRESKESIDSIAL